MDPANTQTSEIGEERFALEKDFRRTVPLYSIAEAARILDMKPPTMRSWVTQRASSRRNTEYVREPIVTSIDVVQHGDWRIPFVGLAEAYVLLFLRNRRISMQRIRRAVDALKKESSIAHALASKSLFTDKLDLFYEYEKESKDRADVKLVRPYDGQTVMVPVIKDLLELITYAADGYAKRLRIDRYGKANVVVDPDMSSGRPIFADTGVRICDVLGRVEAGEDLSEVAQDYDISEAKVRIAWDVERSKAA